jgi:wyosine [tRNA(Phe)-imidazoG37] synthetase (radical SAM superfamily)
MLIPLQQGIIYGPIRSKRLGRSLGLNLFPADRKICSFNCVYCHFGLTTDHTTGGRDFTVPAVADVLAAVEAWLESDHEFDYVTFSGNGEPTLYPGFAQLVPRLRELIHRHRPTVRLALLSNSSTVLDPRLRPAFRQIDLPIFKLDAGDQETFEALNHPCPGIRIADIVAGLVRLAAGQNITIQTALVAGPVKNYAGAAFENWVQAIKEIRPGRIQLYTTDRPVPDQQVLKLADAQLEEVAAKVRELTGIEAKAYY